LKYRAKQEWRKAVKDLNASDKQKAKATTHYRELIDEMAQDLKQYAKNSAIPPNLKLKSNEVKFHLIKIIKLNV
jgi:hypothetical protein